LQLREYIVTTFNIRKAALCACGAIATLTLISASIAQQPRTVDAKLLQTAGTAKDALPGTWLTYGLTQTEQRYSQLKQIDESNVGKLGLAWTAPLTSGGGRGGTEGTPLVWNTTIYQSMDNSVVYALDARTGEQKWMYDAKIDPITRTHMCCGTHNRGLALSDGKLILAANDARLIALDAISGKELWQSKIADINEYYSMTIAPRIAGDKVIVGVGGGEYFIRGFFAAYNLKDGKLAWKFHVVPPKPGQPLEDKAQEVASKTWGNGDWSKYGGGGSVWDGLVYDPETNLVIAGTGNAEPWPQELRSVPKAEWGKWDALYTCSIVAVDAKTGKLKWYYQTVPTDSWDLDSVGGLIMADIQIEGKTRKVVMQAPKSGVFYILDRTNGQFISAEPFVPVNWVKGFDKNNNGKPIINQDAFYDQQNAVLIYPGGGGAHNWAPMSYNPNAGLVYLPYSAGSYTFSAAAEPDPKAGGGAHGLGRGGQNKTTPMPIWGPDNVGRGGMQARDPKTNTIKWVKTGRGAATGGGTMTTASNLLFQVAGNTLYAYKADTGDELLALPFNVPGGAPPVTYMVDGTQYVGFATGTRFMALKVGGTEKMPDAPPARGGFGRGRGGPPAAPPPPPPAPPAGTELHGQAK
jgi:PQQ-dependent dehydrogenase (methanol/ethanol family)